MVYQEFWEYLSSLAIDNKARDHTLPSKSLAA